MHHGTVYGVNSLAAPIEGGYKSIKSPQNQAGTFLCERRGNDKDFELLFLDRGRPRVFRISISGEVVERSLENVGVARSGDSAQGDKHYWLLETPENAVLEEEKVSILGAPEGLDMHGLLAWSMGLSNHALEFVGVG